MKEVETRPWGKFEVLYDSEYCKVKEITVNPGHKLSLQSHKHRKETWVVIKGDAIVEKDDLNDEEPSRFYSLGTGDSIIIEKQEKHRIENRGKEEMVFIEVQTGEYFGEDDIIRYEDSYGRV